MRSTEIEFFGEAGRFTGVDIIVAIAEHCRSDVLKIDGIGWLVKLLKQNASGALGNLDVQLHNPLISRFSATI